MKKNTFKKSIVLFAILTAIFIVLACFVACDNGDEPPAGDPSLKNFEGLTFADLTVDYNGSEHKIEISGTLPEGAQVSYSSNTATNAGVYNATATVSCEGYNTKTLTAKLTVNKINYDMSGAKWDYTGAFTYDGNEKTVAVTGLPEGVTVKQYSGASANNAGNYSATVTFNYDTVNYNAPSINACNWVINKAYITVNVTFDSVTVEYDAKPHAIAIVGNIPAGTTVTYKYNGKAVQNVTEVGEYNVVAVIEGKNYYPMELTATLKIKSTEKQLYAANYDGVIYFQNALDGDKLYKVVGNSVIKVNNDVAEYFFTDGTYLYYYSSSLFSKVIKKINSAGTVSTVCSVNGEYITSDGEYVYYAVNGLLTKEEDRGVYRYALDGSTDTAEKILSCKAAYLCIEGAYLYYSNLSDGKKLYRSALNGSGNTCIHDEKVEYIISDNGMLYFDSTKTASALYKYNTSTGTVTKLTTDSGKYLTKIGNDIYYINNDLLTSTLFGDGIYKISVAASGSAGGTKVLSVTDNGFSSLTSDGEYLYYYKLNDKHLYCFDPETETETDLMEGFVPPVEEITPMGDVNIAEYKGEIYYTNPTDAMLNGACLYKYNPTTGVHVKVLSNDVAGFWFNGDYMYYSTCVVTNYALFRMDMTTGDIVKINSDRCENLIFEGDDIFYVKVDLLTKNKIMKMSAKDITAEPTEIYSDKNIALTGVYKDGDTFYFVMNPSIGYQKIYKYTVGDSKGVDLDSKAFYVAVVGDKLFFYDDSANAIKSCDKDGKNVRTVVSNVDINDLYVDGGKLYFSSKSKTVGVYVYDTATSQQTKISDKVGEGLVVVDGELWFIQTAVTYVADYPVHSGNGDCALYCYNGNTVTKK